MEKIDPDKYDSIEGIEQSLSSYPRFLRLLESRRKAYRDRGERLKDFVVFGAFALDTFGQVGKFSPSPRVVLNGKVPDVVTHKEFFDGFLMGTEFANKGISTVLSPVYIPPINIKCPECGKYYSVDDCHDVYPIEKHEVLFPLKDFVGKNFWEVRWFLKQDHTVSRHIHTGIIVRNDRFIDLRQNPYYDWDSKINERGWMGADEGADDSYVVQEGDETCFSETGYYHYECFVKAMARESREQFEDVLIKAGFVDFTMKEIPNEYGSFNYRGSWFHVTTSIGTFVIGWRKRVIEISLHDWPLDCTRLFMAEQVTVDKQLVHAYGWDKAVEYLQVVIQAVKTARSTVDA